MSGFLMLDLVAACPQPDGTRTDLPTRLHYTPTDPYAIHTTFYPPDGQPVEWHIGRELFADALTHGYAGQGDVTITKLPDQLYLHLNSPDGTFFCHLDRDQVAAFLWSTVRLVPLGTEGKHLDIDGLITQLLEAAS